MRIIGIDPGLNVTGVGIVEVAGNQCRYLHHGAIRTRPSAPKGARLVAIRDGVREMARQWQADAAAVESSFVGNNARSAMALGEARAAAIIGLADSGLVAVEYAPALVKQTVAGYGRGEKSQVAEMVRLQLGLATLPTPADAADALAIAMTHWAHARLNALGARL
ncbi:crossover junction endodeoxyribonuclease RuvC [bacterium]|jgi:crossover junction endodeoxyribonuclease RuvC|nr:crossover junction endodeoxyribonuclease RuvC [bacterium]